MKRYVVLATLTVAGCLMCASVPAKSQNPIAREWQQLFERAKLNQVMAGYRAYNEIARDELSRETEQGCREQAKQITRDLKVNPLSIAVTLTALRCAEMLGEERKAERLQTRLSSLLKYALDSTPPDHGISPVRVIAEADAYAFIEAIGGELLYAYYDMSALPRHLPLRTAIWDAEAKRERQLSFDFLDSMVRLSNDSAVASYPGFRNALAESLLRELDAGPDSAAGESMALFNARTLPSQSERVTAIRQLATQQNYGAAVAFGYHCLLQMPEDDCGGDAVDALLPFAEEHYADALVMIATAYAMGAGVEQNQEAAQALISRANERLGGRLGALRFLALLCTREGAQCPHPWVAEAFEQEVAEGNPLAILVKAQVGVKESSKYVLDASMRESLQMGADLGLTVAQRMLGAFLIDGGEVKQGRELMVRAAQGGDAYAAKYLFGKAGGPKALVEGSKEAQTWATLAATNGSLEAMGALVWRAAQRADANSQKPISKAEWSWSGSRADPPSAISDLQWWLQSGYLNGDEKAGLYLAEIYAAELPGAEGGEAEAEQILIEMVERFNDARAKEQLLTLWFTADPDQLTAVIAKARNLLQAQADAGDLTSQRLLGQALAKGAAEDAVEAASRIRSAAEAGDKEAMGALASMLIMGHGVEVDMQEAVKLLEAAADEVPQALNDLAWYRCTAKNEPIYEPAQGLEFATQLTPKAEGNPALMDTVAACHAANDDFDRAVEVQAKALQILRAWRPDAHEMIEGLNSRLDLYRAGQAYIEVIDRSRAAPK